MPTLFPDSRQELRTSTNQQSAADDLRQPLSCLQELPVLNTYELRTLQNREHTVCFTGHRFVKRNDEAMLERLDLLLEAMYQRGYRDFLCGGAIGFDAIAAEHVALLRQTHPDVKLIFCLPCADQSKKWKKADAERYERLLYQGDEIRVLSPSYYEGCMQVRNAYMVDHSSICAALMNQLRGGTLSTVRYAYSQDVPVVNIAIPTVLEEFDQAFPL